MQTTQIATKKILIIEDTPIMRQILQALLEAQNYKVLIAARGQEGLDIANSAVPDLILLDLLLPDIDGFEIYKRIRSTATTSKIPIIIVTAVEDPTYFARGRELGADGYITKPFDPDELLARVKACLRR